MLDAIRDLILFYTWVLNPNKKDFAHDYCTALAKNDAITIKAYHRLPPGAEARIDLKRVLKKRRNWYYRNGLFDLALVIDTALWVDKEKGK